MKRREFMKRRDFMLALGVAASWPLVARAQTALPVIGFLRSASLADATGLVAAFRQGLKEAGFVEDQNVVIEFRAADNHPDRLPALIDELIRRRAAVIVGNTLAALAAKAATTSVPIVFAVGGDPVTQGLVASLNRPGGNVTGINFLSGVLAAKRLELLRKVVPNATATAMLVNADSPETEAEEREARAAAQTFGQSLIVLPVNSERDMEPAFATLAQRGVGGLLVGPGAFFFSNRDRLIALAARHKIATIYISRESVEDGGLMSYGTSITDTYRLAGIYAARILKGEKPADLPVMRSTKFEFVINLKTAKALGLEIPPTVMALADEVIE